MSDCCNEDMNSYEDIFYQAQIGMPAPFFSTDALVGNDIKEVSLTDYRGKWVVLFFYPLDFTFVCPTELRELAAQKKKFEDLGVEVLPISVDSCYSHMNWKKDLGDDFSFTWLSDMTKDISLTYGTLLEDEGISLRGTFIIDPDGILKSSYINDNSVGRNVDELLRNIEAFQTGELCPASWNKGDKTLGKA
jgi:peroxiredoxin 2/4